MKVNWERALGRHYSPDGAQHDGRNDDRTFATWWPRREPEPESAPDLLSSLRAKIAELEAQIAATPALPPDPPAAPNPVWRAMRFGPLNPMRIGLIARLP